MSEHEPTPLEESRARSGRRWYKISSISYTTLKAGLDTLRGYPLGLTTAALPPADTRPVATDGSGWLLLSIPVWWIRGGELTVIQDLSFVEELTDEEYAALMPEESL